MNLCIITVGQSPRKDFEESIENYFKNIEVFQVGALDDLSYDFPEPKTDNILVSILRDGRKVKIDKNFIVNKIQKIIDEQHHNNIDLILIACTGTFSEFTSEVPIIYPDTLVCDVVNNIVRTKNTLGVLVPDEKQKDYIDEKWNDFNFETTNFYISPYQYSENDIESLANTLNESKLKYIIGDCIGYNYSFKRKLMSLTDKNIILSKDIIFSNISLLNR